MFKRILVPLDGSGRAEQALPVAARLARTSSGSLVLVRVVSTSPEHYPSAPAKPTLAQTVSEADRTLAESYLEGIASSQLLNGIHVKTEVYVGLVAPIILSVASSEKVDIIVICSHGFTRVKRWVLGSVAEKVAHNADVPVLILREDSPTATEKLSNGKQPLHILVPLDGSDYAKAVLAPAAYLATGLTESGNGLLCLTHVVLAPHDKKAKGSDGTTGSDQKSNSNEDVQHAKEYLAAMVSNINDGYIAPDIANLHLKVTSDVVVGSDVAQELLSIAEHGDGAAPSKKVDFDIIAMTTHGHSGIQRWATGSVTGRVLHAAHMPLLIVRPADLARNR